MLRCSERAPNEQPRRNYPLNAKPFSLGDFDFGVEFSVKVDNEHRHRRKEQESDQAEL